MEIERKYLIRSLPAKLETYVCHTIEQAYIYTRPVIRVRQEDEVYYLTCKGDGMKSREELNLPLTPEAYHDLLAKAEGTIISKKRYVIPIENNLKIELDIFSGKWQGLIIAEVEFPDEESSNRFIPPEWFGKEVTFDPHYHNSYLSSH